MPEPYSIVNMTVNLDKNLNKVVFHTIKTAITKISLKQNLLTKFL